MRWAWAIRTRPRRRRAAPRFPRAARRGSRRGNPGASGRRAAPWPTTACRGSPGVHKQDDVGVLDRRHELALRRKRASASLRLAWMVSSTLIAATLRVASCSRRMTREKPPAAMKRVSTEGAAAGAQVVVMRSRRGLIMGATPPPWTRVRTRRVATAPNRPATTIAQSPRRERGERGAAGSDGVEGRACRFVHTLGLDGAHTVRDNVPTLAAVQRGGRPGARRRSRRLKRSSSRAAGERAEDGRLERLGNPPGHPARRRLGCFARMRAEQRRWVAVVREWGRS